VKSNWRIFLIGNGKKIQEFLSAKEWQDLIDFEGNANGFTVLTGTRPGSKGSSYFLCYTRALMKYQKKVCQRNQQVILLIKVWFLSNR
jgi:hypothetical protein